MLVTNTAPPVTMPDDEPTVATAVVPLTHVPPAGTSLNAVVRPAHTVSVPEIAAGNELTVTTAVLIQPVGSVYVIVSIPGVTPFTIPVEPMVAFPLLAIQVPPPASDNVVVRPRHTVSDPEIAFGNGFTVTTVLIAQPVVVNL